MEVCPSDVVQAPAERVWQLLVEPLELARWTGTKLAQGPGRALRPGDLLVLRAGPLHARFEVLDAEPPQSLGLRVRLPFGIVNHERIQITRAGSSTCRVTFN
jgi:uncharacterized protein YndB with AHSA1/START domain